MGAANTLPKGRPTVNRPGRRIPATMHRHYHGADHFAPLSGRDHEDRQWKGASRIIDPARKRRLNRRSWRRILADARRDDKLLRELAAEVADDATA